MKVSHVVTESWLQKDRPPSVWSRRCSCNSSDEGPGQLVPIGGLLGMGGRCIWEHGHRPPGWLEGRLLSCVCHCHQNCLSHMSRAASVRAVSLGICCLPHVCSTPACRMRPGLDICLPSGTQSRKADVCPCTHLRATGTCFHSPAPIQGAANPSPATCAVPEPAQVQVTSCVLTRKAGAVLLSMAQLSSVPSCPITPALVTRA